MKIKKEQVEEFIIQSNAIEGEFSQEAFDDAKQAWICGVTCIGIGKEEITPDLILALHRRLMKRLNPRIAGKIRTCDVWVGNRKGLNPKEIKEELRLLCCHSLNPWYIGEDQIKDWHIQFEKIHPFEDGNGRVGRILMNLQRLKLKLPILIIRTGKEQANYYRWFL